MQVEVELFVAKLGLTLSLNPRVVHVCVKVNSQLVGQEAQEVS